MKSRSIFSIATTMGVLAAGCTGGPPRETVADLSRAKTLIAEAERSGAQQYAGEDLQAARDKAQQADEFAKQHDAKRADQLANEAAVDAQLATARAENGKAQHDAADLHHTLETLRNEEQRNASAPVGESSKKTPASVPPPPEGLPSKGLESPPVQPAQPGPPN